MARFDGGWVKLHRKLFESDIAKNRYCFVVFCWLLARANYKESKMIWNGEQRTIKPGQCVYGIREIADFYGIGLQTVHRWIGYLVSTERIRNEVGTHGSLATICNWEFYQGNDSEEEQDRNDKGTREERQRNVSEESKNINTKGAKKISRKGLEKVEGTEKFLAKYYEIFKSKYGQYPPRQSKDVGIAKRLVKDNGLERAIELVTIYVNSREELFQKRKHDLGTFSQNLNVVALSRKSAPHPAVLALQKEMLHSAEHNNEDPRKGPMPEKIKSLLEQIKKGKVISDPDGSAS